METHSDIIRRLGGIRKVAGMLEHSSHTTVQGWADRSRIPVEHWAGLIQAASSHGKTLAVDDLMPAELKGAA